MRYLGIVDAHLVAAVTSNEAAEAVERLFAQPVGWVPVQPGYDVHLVQLSVADIVKLLGPPPPQTSAAPPVPIPQGKRSPASCGHCAHHLAAGANCCFCGKEGARA